IILPGNFKIFSQTKSALINKLLSFELVYFLVKSIIPNFKNYLVSTTMVLSSIKFILVISLTSWLLPWNNYPNILKTESIMEGCFRFLIMICQVDCDIGVSAVSGNINF
ncbi:hypothetical protein L9F63_013101, partial [Diploptera punctata]